MKELLGLGDGLEGADGLMPGDGRDAGVHADFNECG
jgi:hypothetical protein